MKNDHKIKST